ncbi:MAG: hypothetical protein J3K34DRAFT_525818 [Monoraphidium minutum]|nr:MAG: hypothetical protein J3K34DRAFT_525818 [Monoraphidium minutum]
MLNRPGVVEEVEGMGDSGSPRWARPVRCRVGGGFVVSRLAGATGAADSEECLVTLVLNVQDLGGWLSPRSLVRRLVAPGALVGAATEALVERMLMAVMLVRDTVEQNRFAIHPGLMRAGGAVGVGASAAAGAGVGQDGLQRSATLVMRRAAQRSSGGFAAAASAAHAHVPSASAAATAAGAVARMGRLASAARAASASLSAGGAAGTIGGAAGPSLGGAALSDEALVLAAAVPDGGDEPQPPTSLPSSCFEELHTPGHDAPFKVRGPRYLTDGKKVTAGTPVFSLVGVELFETDGCLQHISRYLPSVRRSPAPFLFVFHLSVPGPPTLSLVFVYASGAHPEALSAPPEDPDEGDWEPFDWLMYRFIKGTDEDRAGLFKMIPHIAEGSWVIRSAVGTTPVILARKLASQFYVTDKYVEVCVDVGSNGTANYVTGMVRGATHSLFRARMVRGATRSLVIDLALLLEGGASYELPETLIGACRMPRIDLGLAQRLDTSREVPIRHVAAPKAADGAAEAGAAAATP